MKKLFNIISIAVLIFSIFSCSEYEQVTIYHEPYLNIFANVTSGGPDSNFVYVLRTTGYGEPDRYELDSVLYHEFYNPSSGDTIRYETLYIDTVYAINDAKVFFLHNGDSIEFYEASQGYYRMVDSTTRIIAGEEYELVVETKEFETATSTEEALEPISWTNPAEKSDTIWMSINEPYADTIKWTDIGGAYGLLFTRTYSYSWGSWEYLFEQVELRDPFWTYDTSNYDNLFNPDPFWGFLESEWNPDTLILQARIVAFSESYLDYRSLEQMALTTGFIRYPTINDFRVNIDNALGAFTSYSISDRRTVMFTK